MKHLLFLILIPTIISTAYCQSEKTDKIQSLLNVLESDNRIGKMLNELINSQIEAAEFSDSVFWEKYKSKMYPILQDSIKPEIISIYDKYFSEQEIDVMYDFYSSDLGKQTLTKMDKISQEIMAVTLYRVRTMIDEILEEEAGRLENEIDYKTNNEFTGCDKFRIGKFQYISSDSLVYYYDRTETQQIETFGEGRTVFNISWLNDCKYELVIESTNNPYMSEQIGMKMIVNIFEVSGDSYKYVLQVENSSKIFEGELTKIE